MLHKDIFGAQVVGKTYRKEDFFQSPAKHLAKYLEGGDYFPLCSFIVCAAQKGT